MLKPIFSVAGVALVLVACGERGDRDGDIDDSAVPDSLRYGGTAVTAFLSEASSMNELASIDANSEELQAFVLFTTLIQYDENRQPAPYLAESWDTVTNGRELSLTFHLHDDVRWHDGVPTTAHDVKFTFDRIKDPATVYPRVSQFALYDSAVVQDSFTITFYLQSHQDYMDPWRMLAPMPAHLLADVPPDELASHPFGTQNPVGNGPFRFLEHRSGDRWVFEANPDFPESLGGPPYLDRLVYRVILDPTTRISSFLIGEVDLYFTVDPSQVQQIRATAEARLISYPSRTYVFINWNGRRPLFQDARVRRALTMAIDRQQIIDAVRYGFGAVATGPVPPFHWAHDSELERLPYDPDSARALLDAAGWVDRDGDGVRERDVIRASFELKTNPNPTREDIMTMVQADLAAVGFEVRTRVQESQSLFADIASPERVFDAFVLGWDTQFRIDDRVLFGCDSPQGTFQWASYCNPRVDQLLDQLSTIDDRSSAIPLWDEYQQIIQWDQPYTFIYYEVVTHAVQDYLRDVRADIRGSLINVADWWIRPSQRRTVATRRTP